jgi:hypothetical protein
MSGMCQQRPDGTAYFKVDQSFVGITIKINADLLSKKKLIVNNLSFSGWFDGGTLSGTLHKS